jgi:hypothetical protein
MYYMRVMVIEGSLSGSSIQIPFEHRSPAAAIPANQSDIHAYIDRFEHP